MPPRHSKRPLPLPSYGRASRLNLAMREQEPSELWHISAVSMVALFCLALAIRSCRLSALKAKSFTCKQCVRFIREAVKKGGRRLEHKHQPERGFHSN